MNKFWFKLEHNFFHIMMVLQSPFLQEKNKGAGTALTFLFANQQLALKFGFVDEPKWFLKRWFKHLLKVV